MSHNKPYAYAQEISSSLEDSSASELLDINTTTSKTPSANGENEEIITDSKRKKRVKIFFLSFIIIIVAVSIIATRALFAQSLSNSKIVFLPLINKLTKNIERETFTLSNNVNITFASDNDAQFAHVSLGINSNKLSREFESSKGLFFCEFMSRLMLEYPLKKWQKGTTSSIFTIVRSECVNNWVIFDYRVDNGKVFSSIQSILKWINSGHKEALKSSQILDKVFANTNKAKTFQKDIDDFIEKNIIDDILINDLKESDFRNNLKSFSDKLSKSIKSTFVSDNMNVIVYSKPNIIAEEKENIMRIFLKLNSRDEAEVEERRSEKKLLKDFGYIVWVETKSKSRYFIVNFMLMNITDRYDVVYMDYLRYVLSSKREKGTLYSSLLSSSLIEDIQVDIIQLPQAANSYALRINYAITGKGAFEVEDIIQTTLKFIYMLNKKPSEMKFNEFYNSMRIFENYANFDALKYVSTIHNIYLKGVSFKDYKGFNITKYHRNLCDKFTPKNMIIIYKSKTQNYFQLDILPHKEQKQYVRAIKPLIDSQNFVYFCSTLSWKNSVFNFYRNLNTTVTEKDLDSIEFKENQYLTKKKAIVRPESKKEKDEMAPELIFDTQRSSVYLRTDRSFSSPKVILYIYFVSEYIRSNNDTEYFAHVLFFNSLKQRVQSQLSDAIQAGNSIEAHLTDNGLTLRIDSFNDVLPLIMDQIFQIFCFPKITLPLFQKTKNDDFNYVSYYSLKQKGIWYFRRLIKKNKPYFVHQIEFSNSKLQELITSITFKTHVDALFYGDTNKNTILPFLQKYKKYFEAHHKFTINRKFINDLQTHKSFNGSYIFRVHNADINEKQNFLMNYYRVLPTSPKTYIQMKLLLPLLQKYVNKVEDTKVEILEFDKCLYFCIEAKSLEFSPKEINISIDSKIRILKKEINELSNEKLKQLKGKELLETKVRFDTLDQKAARVWKEIFEETFDYQISLVSPILVNYSKDDLLSFYENIFVNEVRKLSVQIFSATKEYDLTPEKYTVNKNISSIVTNDTNIFHDKIST